VRAYYRLGRRSGVSLGPVGLLLFVPVAILAAGVVILGAALRILVVGIVAITKALAPQASEDTIRAVTVVVVIVVLVIAAIVGVIASHTSSGGAAASATQTTTTVLRINPESLVEVKAQFRQKLVAHGYRAPALRCRITLNAYVYLTNPNVRCNVTSGPHHTQRTWDVAIGILGWRAYLGWRSSGGDGYYSATLSGNA
jgi:hypothetical protein